MRLLLVLLLAAAPALACQTAYVTFDHPENWSCELSQGVWVVQSNLDADRKDAVVLSIATIATEWDSLDRYEDYLKTPRTIQDEDGSQITSKISYTRRRNINGVTWVDSLQHDSELPGFWSRYLATVHQAGQTKLAILITYIVTDDKYQKLAPQFERMVSSLKPNEDFDLNVATKQNQGPLPGSSKLGTKEILRERLGLKKKKDKTPQEAPESPLPMLLTLVGGVGVVLFILRRRRTAAKKPRGSTPAPKRPPQKRVG